MNYTSFTTQRYSNALVSPMAIPSKKKNGKKALHVVITQQCDSSSLRTDMDAKTTSSPYKNSLPFGQQMNVQSSPGTRLTDPACLFHVGCARQCSMNQTHCVFKTHNTAAHVNVVKQRMSKQQLRTKYWGGELF